jgi:hypothetical protein
LNLNRREGGRHAVDQRLLRIYHHAGRVIRAELLGRDGTFRIRRDEYLERTLVIGDNFLITKSYGSVGFVHCRRSRKRRGWALRFRPKVTMKSPSVR